MPDHLTPDVERELAALDDALAGRPVAPDLSELGELALLLREDRPRPTASFGAGLDARVQRGFSSGGPRRRASRRRWAAWGAWTAPALGVAATALLVAVVALTVPRDADELSGAGGGGGASVADRESAGSAGTASSASAADDAATSLAEPTPTGSVAPAPGLGSPGTDGRARRQVERSASITLAARPRNIDAVSARVQEVTRQQGGFVVASTVDSSEGGGGGSFELRVPTRNLDAAMAALARLGRVRERAQRAQDITARAVSARSRLQDARTERSALLEQLADALTLQETESISARLRLVSREIERARAGVRRVRNRAAFSTVAVTLVAELAADADEDGAGVWTPGDAVRDAVRVLEVAAGVALIVLALAVPLGALALLALPAVRWTRRRRREHALDAI